MLIAPAVAWIAWSRLAFWPSLALSLLCMTVPLALVPGGTDPVLSLTAQASRWAWALAFLIIPVVLFPPIQGRAGDWADAVVLGLPMAALVMVKPGGALALLPACVLGLLLSGRGRLLLRALLLALAVLALVTLAAGAPSGRPTGATCWRRRRGAVRRPLWTYPAVAGPDAGHRVGPGGGGTFVGHARTGGQRVDLAAVAAGLCLDELPERGP